MGIDGSQPLGENPALAKEIKQGAHETAEKARGAAREFSHHGPDQDSVGDKAKAGLETAAEKTKEAVHKATAKSKAKQSDVDKLADEVNAAWWKKNRKRFIK